MRDPGIPKTEPCGGTNVAQGVETGDLVGLAGLDVGIESFF